MNIIGWLLFGLVVGAIAKFLMPGRDPGGWIVTILLGIAGSLIVGFFMQSVLHVQGEGGFIPTLIGATIGAMLLIAAAPFFLA